MNSRYQPGGDIYDKLLSQYGQDGADQIAAADASDVPYAVTDAIAQVRSGAPLNDSTLSNFWNQITTDPLSAPLQSADNQIGNAVMSVFKQPWVVAVLLIWLALELGGFEWLKKQFR